MNKKRRLKPFVKVFLVAVILCIGAISMLSITNLKTKPVALVNDGFSYVNDYIFDSYSPVSNQQEKILKPYSSDKVTVYRNFYEKDGTEEEQQKSIILSDGTYMQNSGVDYSSDEIFDVTASTSGTVTNVSEDTTLGKTVEVRNSTQLIMTYQSLSEVSVKKGDTISQGQIIGKSGICSLNSDVKNGLHFEIYKDGQVVNPEKTYNKSLKELNK